MIVDCDICHSRHEAGDRNACVSALRANLRTVQVRAGVHPTRTNPIKDQSGVDASTEFMRLRGLAAYPARETHATLMNRVTEPITIEHYVRVVTARICLGCGSGLRCVSMPNGSKFWACATGEPDGGKGCGWYIGYTSHDERGYQVRLDPAALEEAA